MKPEEKKENKPKKNINIKKIVLIVVIVIILVTAVITSFFLGMWNKKHPEVLRYGYQYDDKTLIVTSFEVPYKNYSLFVAFKDKDLSLDDFIKKLDVKDKDNNNTLYSYDKTKKVMGKKSFFAMSCNSNETIYISRYEENLKDVCNVKYDDLDGLSMNIKDNSVTADGCTLVIENTKNYEIPDDYYIQYKNGLVWLDLDTINSKVSSNKVYKDSSLELNLNWKNEYGSLIKGNYRIVKIIKVNDKLIHNITASFEIK